MKSFFLLFIFMFNIHANPNNPQTRISDQYGAQRLAKDSKIILTGDPILDERELKKAVRDQEVAYQRENQNSEIVTDVDVFKERKRIQSLRGE